VSHALEMTINLYYPTLELFCFSFTQPFTYSKFSLPNPFLFGATPAINNERSLTKKGEEKISFGKLICIISIFVTRHIVVERVMEIKEIQQNPTNREN
jgi:hypothetical protein